MALFETHDASDGKSADYPDPAEYQGCMEARERRRACYDDACKVRDTCRLWTERDAPEYATRAMTWRTHWRCFSEPCDYWKSSC